MPSNRAGALVHPARSIHAANSGGPASEPRLPACASNPLIGPMARGSAASLGTAAKQAAGTRPPSAKDSANPAVAAPSGAATPSTSAATAVDAIRPVAAKPRGASARRISPPATTLPAMPHIVTMPTSRPADAEPRLRRSIR